MKRFRSLSIFAGVLFAAACAAQPCRASDSMTDTTIYTSDSVRTVNATEEAHKIRHLAKIALSNEATAESRQVFSEEIAIVEKNKKLKTNVTTLLLQDDDPDPTLPIVTLVRYKDGAVRGLLFTQTDAVRGGKPNRLAWPLDPKREQKEQTR